jgi:small basic protein
MIWLLAIVLGLLWVMGIGSSYSFGGYLHILIFAALLLAAFRLIQNQRHKPAR